MYLIYKKYEPSSPRSAVLLLAIVPGVLVAVFRQHFGSLAAAVLTLYATYWSLLITFVTVYRLSPFHPLARYPGPVLYKISMGWLAYVSWRDRKAYIYVHELHKRYGDVVRIGT